MPSRRRPALVWVVTIMPKAGSGNSPWSHSESSLAVTVWESGYDINPEDATAMNFMFMDGPDTFHGQGCRHHHPDSLCHEQRLGTAVGSEMEDFRVGSKADGAG